MHLLAKAAPDCSLAREKSGYYCFWFPHCFLYSAKLTLPGVKGWGKQSLALWVCKAQQRKAVVLLPDGGASHELRAILSDRAPAAAWIKISLSTPRLNASLNQLAGQLLCFFSCLRLPLMCIWSRIQHLFVLDHRLPGTAVLLAESIKQNSTVYWHRWARRRSRDSTATSVGASVSRCHSEVFRKYFSGEKSLLTCLDHSWQYCLEGVHFVGPYTSLEPNFLSTYTC